MESPLVCIDDLQVTFSRLRRRIFAQFAFALKATAFSSTMTFHSHYDREFTASRWKERRCGAECEGGRTATFEDSVGPSLKLPGRSTAAKNRGYSNQYNNYHKHNCNGCDDHNCNPMLLYFAPYVLPHCSSSFLLRNGISSLRNAPLCLMGI